MVFALEFRQPETLAELNLLATQLKQDVTEIQVQLLQPQRLNPDGTVMSPAEYLTWRRRATGALYWKRQALANLKPLRAQLAPPSGPPTSKNWRKPFGKLLALVLDLEQSGRLTLSGAEGAMVDAMREKFNDPDGMDLED